MYMILGGPVPLSGLEGNPGAGCLLLKNNATGEALFPIADFPTTSIWPRQEEP